MQLPDAPTPSLQLKVEVIGLVLSNLCELTHPLNQPCHWTELDSTLISKTLHFGQYSTLADFSEKICQFWFASLCCYWHFLLLVAGRRDTVRSQDHQLPTCHSCLYIMSIAHHVTFLIGKSWCSGKGICCSQDWPSNKLVLDYFGTWDAYPVLNGQFKWPILVRADLTVQTHKIVTCILVNKTKRQL